jgi:hypothetical protein
MAESNEGTLLTPQSTTQGDATSLVNQSSEATQTETPPAQAAEQSGKAPEAAAPAAAVEFTDFKLPDGMEPNKPMFDEFKAIAKDLKLNQEQAQKLVDVQAKYIQAQDKLAQDNFEATKKQLKDEAIKALGPNYQKELSYAAKAIERFGGPELRTLLDQTGFGNHKDVINFFIKAGKAISEDTFVEGEKQKATKTDGEIFFPDMK